MLFDRCAFLAVCTLLTASSLGCAPQVDGADESGAAAAELTSIAQVEDGLINSDNGVIGTVQLSYRSTIELAVQAGMACDGDVVTMAAIARQESTFRVKVVGPENANGTYDYGLWQINSTTGAMFGYQPSDLVQSGPNAAAMMQILAAQGLDAWASHKFGRDTKYLPYAQQAFDTYNCQ